MYADRTPNFTGKRTSFLVLLCLALSVAGCAKKVKAPDAYRFSPAALKPPEARNPLPTRGLTKQQKQELLTAAQAPYDERRIEEFRSVVERMEQAQAVNEDASNRILQSYAESITAPSNLVYVARYGAYYRSSSMDILPVFRVKTLCPLLAAGAKDFELKAEVPDQPGLIRVTASKELEGFETSWYQVEDRSDGVKLKYLSSEQNRLGKITTSTKPETLTLTVPDSARQLRLLFLRRKSESDRDLHLVGAPTKSGLDDAVKRFESSDDPLTACRSDRAVYCFPLPKLAAVNLEQRVTVNGKLAYIPVGGTIRDAMAASGEKDFERQNELAAKLKVMRPWRGKLIPVVNEAGERAILSLVLLGGEQISY
jgi:hypothetical protein